MPELQALVDLAAQVCSVPSAAINLMPDGAQHQVAASGIEPSVCSLEDSMCWTVMDEPDVVVVADASKDPRFADNPFVTGVIADVRFYATAPLTTPAGLTVGRLCVFDSVERDLSSAQRQALAILAQRVSDALELRLRSNQLEESLRELTKARDELRRSNEGLALFAAQVSHDFRNPLTAILANAEVMMEEPCVAADERAPALVQAIFSAAKRMESMMAEVLSNARIGGHVVFEDADLNSVVAAVLADLQPVLRETGATVDAGILPRFRGDERQVYAVLLNLVHNAVKYAGPRVRPAVSIHAAPAMARGFLRIWVEDNGPGIPVRTRELVFRPFVRADTSIPGSGLGLATSKRIVEAHGGRIGIENGTSGGTRVWFELPRPSLI